MLQVTRRFSAVSVGVLVAGFLAGASVAHADTPVVCGQTVTASITLANDLGPCLGDGLVVTASNVVVDLNGHTIRGAGSNPAGAIDQAGIRLADVESVTVQGGTVRNFFVGVLAKDGQANKITHMTVSHNIGLGNTAYGDGINLDGSVNNQVTYNAVTGNGPIAGINMIHNGSHNHVAYNTVVDNNVLTPNLGPGGSPQQQDSGISNDSGASFNLIENNTVRGSGFFGIALSGGPVTQSETAKNNVVRDSGNIGINAGTAGDGHVVTGNVVVNSGREQFGPSNFAGFDGGIVTCGTCFGPGKATHIVKNTVTGNVGFGIALLFNGHVFPGQPYQAPRSNLVQDNVVTANTGDGIFVECETQYDVHFVPSCLTTFPKHRGERVLNNISTGNGGDGAGVTAWDLHDGNARCDDNIWFGNTYTTAKPACTTAGGTFQPHPS